MAGPRTNLAVTKDGETYNKLQRPQNYLDESASAGKANERKRERDNLIVEPFLESKRARIAYPEPAASSKAASDGFHQYRNNAPVAECGMRFTLPIDDDEAQCSDDSLGDALAYLRSVRSEASTIPNLLIASTTRTDGANPVNEKSSEIPKTSDAPPSRHAFYQDGAWISLDEHYEWTYDNGDEDKDMHVQGQYYHGLVKRFQNLRSALEHGIYKLAKSDRNSDQPLSLQPPSNRHDWLYTIDREFPITAQICQLDEYSVRRGLEYCVHALGRFDTISKQKSCWIWTLLALSGDVGTLDSQKMSHIRDLAVKAAEMSDILHAGSEREAGQAADSLLEYSADKAQDIGNEVGEPIYCVADTDSYNSGTGYVRFDSNKDVNAAPVALSGEVMSGTQDDAGCQSDQAAETHEKANTVMNDNALEEARARLLAQLGDNLIHAGIPTPSLVTDKRHPGHIVQPGQDSDPTQHENKVRAIPSRAEAERQRQVMRLRESAAAGSRQPESERSDRSTVIIPATDDTASCVVDLNTRVTIDMILTVVGECYGQRDLLRFRKSW